MNFHHNHIVGMALPSQSISNTTVNGSTISKPWTKGRELSFIVNGGAFASSADAEIDIQVQEIDGGTWVTALDADGNNLAFTATLYDDGGGGENAVVLGTIPLELIDSDTYKAIRVSVTESATAAVLVGVTYVISDLYETVSGQTDDLFGKSVRYA